MKTIYRVLASLLTATLLTGTVALAQAPSDVYRNGLREVGGTARAQAMSDAVGALGADATAVSINPAGIGLYRSMEFGFGFDFGKVKSTTNWRGIGDVSVDKWLGNLDQVSFITPLGYNPTSDWRFALGVVVNSVYNYDRKYEMQLVEPEYSMTEFIANKATAVAARPGQLQSLGSTPSFLASMGYLGGFIELADGTEDIYIPATYAAVDPFAQDKYGDDNITFLLPHSGKLNVSEKGSRTAYDFTFGGSWRDRLFFGIGLHATASSYSRLSLYREDYSYVYRPQYDEPDQVYYTELGNSLTVNGRTAGLSLGLLASLGDFGRVGISYRTPQVGSYDELFYTTTSWYNSNRTDDKGDLAPLYEYGTDDMTNSYDLLLPGDLTVSAMAFLGGYGMVTYDFNWRNLGTARFLGDGFEDLNTFLGEDHGNQMTHRVGLEIRPISGLYLRGGYSYTGSGLKADGLKPVQDNDLTYDYIASGAITDTALRDSYQSISAGIGVNLFGGSTLDLAYVYGKVNERVFPFPATPDVSDGQGNVLAPAVNDMTTTTHKLVASFTFRF